MTNKKFFYYDIITLYTKLSQLGRRVTSSENEEKIKIILSAIDEKRESPNLTSFHVKQSISLTEENAKKVFGSTDYQAKSLKYI